MKKPNNHFKIVFLTLIVGFFFHSFLKGQTLVKYTEDDPKYVEIKVESGSPYLYLKAKGADGGDATDKEPDGGLGAIVSGYITIGSGANEVPVGSTLRFIPSKSGVSYGKRGSGGGGTGILFQAPGKKKWNLLMVAGGGGGAGKSYSGRAGTTSTGGSNGINRDGRKLDNAGKDGKGGGDGPSGGGGGGYLGNGDGLINKTTTFNVTTIVRHGGSAGMNSDDEPLGGLGGVEDIETGNGANGGFGFGGGGAALKSGAWIMEYAGGGGGGYSGGGGGNYNGGGGGGGSFADEDYVSFASLSSGGTTISPNNGFIVYQYMPVSPVKTIPLAKNTAYCVGTEGSKTSNGKNIELIKCSSSTKHHDWIFDGKRIFLSDNIGKCINAESSKTSNGTNVQLWDCDSGDAQNWVYDGRLKAIRYLKKVSKCLTVSGENNIELLTCKYGDEDQIFNLESATTSTLTTKVGTIRLYDHQDKCINNDSGGTENGNKIQLYDCKGTNGSGNDNQVWYFDGAKIKLNNHQDKCMDLASSNTADGTDIRLWDCNGTDAQKWVYDGLTKSIRSAVNSDKCVDLKKGRTSNGTNVQLEACIEKSTQRFVLK